MVIFRSPNTFDHPESSGRDDDTGALIELAQQMEQQRTAGLAERQVTNAPVLSWTVEAAQIAGVREARHLHLVVDRALGHLDLEQHVVTIDVSHRFIAQT